MKKTDLNIVKLEKWMIYGNHIEIEKRKKLYEEYKENPFKSWLIGEKFLCIIWRIHTKLYLLIMSYKIF